MEVTILQVSDLHRDPTHPLSNSALLNSIQRDQERWGQENPAIPSPDLIVVCGDLVRGVPPSTTNAKASLKTQYAEAQKFLIALADHFLCGDRERIIVVPGNHDVSFPQTLSSLRRLATVGARGSALTAAGCFKSLSNPHTTLRWSWDDLSFYEITDRLLYEARLEAFAEFYEEFYQGNRAYSLNPLEQHDIFDYAAMNLTLVGFNSCYNNDPLNRSGCIHADCLSKAAALLRERDYRNRLVVALWHHNVNGGPFRSDYLDADVLQVLIDNGFSLGLHGHQHKPHFIEERFQFGGQCRITVIAAGTLCGGPDGLPAGHTRGYNLVTIDTERCVGKLHQRRMLNEGFDTPIWGPGWFPLTSKSYIEFSIQRPLIAPQQRYAVTDLGEAEELIRRKQYVRAAELLVPLHSTHPLARRLLLECYVLLDASPNIVKYFYPPISNSEIVHVADALWAQKDLNRLRCLIESDAVRENKDPAVNEVCTKYAGRIG